MSAAYQHLALTEVKPGMILSDELLDPQGQVLLPAGTVLTANMLALLPGHGIDALAVLRTGADLAAQARPDPDAVALRLDQLFRKHDPNDPVDRATAMLRRYVTEYRMETRRDIERERGA